MDNLSDPHLKYHTFEKIGSLHDDNITIYYSIINLNEDFKRGIYLTMTNDDIIGEFGIKGGGLNQQFDSGKTNDMHICIDDNYQGYGLSKIMIKYMIDRIYKDIPNINGEQMIFIDADASAGFWDKIGMIESKRYGYDRNPKYADREGAGYEKYITINKLYKFSKSFSKNLCPDG